MLAIHAVLTTHVTSLNTTDWGILSRLPITYWVGLGLVGVLILFSLRNAQSLSLKVSLTIFVLILVYTNFVPQIIETPIGLSRFSLWPSSQASLTISTGHISVGQPKQMLDYNNWPFFTVFTSIFMLITGSPLGWLAKWFPLFTITLWALLVFIILKKFLEPKYSLIGAALFLCGSWTKQQYFGPQSFAFVLFLIAIFLLFQSKNPTFNFSKKPFVILTVITFIGLVFSHVLTPVALLLMVITVYLIVNMFDRHDVKSSKSLWYFILLCITIVIAYNVYVTPNFISYGFNQIVAAFGSSVTQQLGRVAGSQYQTFTNASIYGLVGGFFGVSLLGLFLMSRNKNQPKLQTLTWFGATGAMFLIAIIPYGQEGPFRAFIFALPFLALICVSLLKRKPKLLGSLMVVFLILSVPAIYGSDSYRLATDSEMKGTTYIVQYLPDASLVFGRLSTYVRYFNPLTNMTFQSIGAPPFLSYDPISIEQNLDKTNYMAVSRNDVHYYEYYTGANPYQGLNLSQNINVTSSCLYDNGNFSVYLINPFMPIRPTG
jgi:hypothetical protein